MNGMAAVLVCFCFMVPPPRGRVWTGKGKRKWDSHEAKCVASKINRLLMGMRCEGVKELVKPLGTPVTVSLIDFRFVLFYFVLGSPTVEPRALLMLSSHYRPTTLFVH